MNRIIECVPNFSEGRRPEVVAAIVAAIRSAPGVTVLDVTSDPDHNRSVVTFVGSPETVAEGAFRGIAKAAELIDLDQHTGEHPRMGATDVVPFVPVKNVTAKECAAIARDLGRRVGDELGICVYLYGDAATRPEREKLPDIRKGQYEGWKAEIGLKPEREPDFGPAVPKPWGATVIGARPFLIAYNLYLNSDRVDIADQISRSIRFTSGGLRFVQAKGFLVEGQAQVSMNLTNFDKTSLHLVQETVKRLAAQHGLTVTRAELIGMIPQKALTDAAKWYLQLHDLDDLLVLENKLAQVAAQDTMSGMGTFINAVASSDPAPGGGAVAALAGALAASLAQMVAGLTVGRKKYAAVNDQAQAVLDGAEGLRAQLTTAIAEDAAAFVTVMAAFRDKSVGEDQRAAAIETAMIHAGEVPLEVMRLSREVAGLLREIAGIGNVNAASDAGAAGFMAQAAVKAAGLNVKTNAVGLKDRVLAQAWLDEVAVIETEVDQIVTEIAATAAQRGGFA
ncbi:MAG: glutamate formimidoyltransferase [Caldilineaceae bacterium]|nr:glutamate formimidoyltransferase [Caldilineaceae bacterium]MBP8109664.1 glutamate formimidoyltransferase [Caldilineaceae bacterium]MBP8125549.1 glutamate formimidoyltransferase [Caldilineaceae bacterium]MBP9071848.1 glutamate formimidoyltransferase [Caldilineaceae bacterium]